MIPPMDKLPKRIIGIDPGTITSGIVIYDPVLRSVLLADGKMANEGVKQVVHSYGRAGGGEVAVHMEVVKAIYSGHVGMETIQTIRFTGALAQLCVESHVPLVELSPQEVKDRLCNAPSAKDPAVRQALIDLLGPVGTKKNPGPCFGVSSHAWRALAVAVAGTMKNPRPDKKA